MGKQRIHYRRSKKGKLFVAGSKRRSPRLIKKRHKFRSSSPLYPNWCMVCGLSRGAKIHK